MAPDDTAPRQVSPGPDPVAGPERAADFSRRLAFAHVLRGVAALSVLASHYLDMFWTEPAVVASLLGVPAMPSHSLPSWYRGILATLSPHGMGQFGVALFFLISGFVIPFSLLSLSRTGFLVARAMRLWPTYAVGFAVTMLAVWACDSWFGQPFQGSARVMAAHILFVRDLLWLPSLDGIGWTLEIEVKFYLVCAVLAGSIRAGRMSTLLAFAGGAVVVTWAISGSPALVQAGWYYAVLRVVTLNAQMICYMLIGATVNAMHRGRISARHAGIVGGALFCAFAVQWPWDCCVDWASAVSQHTAARWRRS